MWTYFSPNDGGLAFGAERPPLSVHKAFLASFFYLSKPSRPMTSISSLSLNLTAERVSFPEASFSALIIGVSQLFFPFSPSPT